MLRKAALLLSLSSDSLRPGDRSQILFKDTRRHSMKREKILAPVCASPG